jgi:anti-anti-sigma regulatory factor
MQVHEHYQPGLLSLRVADKSLVRRPPWEEILAPRRPDTLLVVLDLQGVDFISSLFLQSCVELARTLVAGGQQLALANLSPHQERLLGVIEGSSVLSVLKGEDQLKGRLELLRTAAAQGCSEKGVTPVEKRMLWD